MVHGFGHTNEIRFIRWKFEPLLLKGHFETLSQERKKEEFKKRHFKECQKMSLPPPPYPFKHKREFNLEVIWSKESFFYFFLSSSFHSILSAECTLPFFVETSFLFEVKYKLYLYMLLAAILKLNLTLRCDPRAPFNKKFTQTIMFKILRRQYCLCQSVVA